MAPVLRPSLIMTPRDPLQAFPVHTDETFYVSDCVPQSEPARTRYAIACMEAWLGAPEMTRLLRSKARDSQRGVGGIVTFPGWAWDQTDYSFPFSAAESS